MVIEELAYRIDAIKTSTITDTFPKEFNFKGEMGYIKNQSAEAILMSVVPPNQYATDSNWGIPAKDAAYRIDPGEVVGPLFLGTLYFQVTTPGTEQLLIIIQGVR